MAEYWVEEIEGKLNYLNNIDVARKAKLITQFIMYHIELKTGINFNLIDGDNNDIEHTDEDNDADTMNNNHTNLSAQYNDAYNDVMTDNDVTINKKLENIAYNCSNRIDFILGYNTRTI